MKLPDLHNNPLVINVFYGFVLVIAAVGSGLAAMHWMGWPLVFALPAVLLGELAGIVLLQMADQRRRLGESAYAARLLSAAVATGMVLLNWFGHADNPKQAGFFAGASATGYVIWLIHSGSRRRDQLRADKRLAETPPAYGLARWLRRPFATAEARQIAQQFPDLGLHGSLEVVRLRPVIRPWLGKILTEVHGKESARFMIAIMDAKGMADMVKDLIRFDVIAVHLANTINAPYLTEAIVGKPLREALPDTVVGQIASDPAAPAEGVPPASANGHTPQTGHRPAPAADRRDDQVQARVPRKRTTAAPTGTRYEKANDEARVQRLTEMARESRDGTVGVREAMRELGITQNPAIRLLDIAGVRRYEPTEAAADR